MKNANLGCILLAGLIAALNFGCSGQMNPAANLSSLASSGGGQTGATPAPIPMATTAGISIPSGWTLKAMDRFGSGGSSNVTNYSALHAKYYEGQYYNRNSDGTVRLPNVVINNEQQTYRHFEETMVFATDHLKIQARGQSDGSIFSGEMVSKLVQRSFCVEARYRIPNTDKSWGAFWLYGATSDADISEIDFEQPITPNQGVADVSMHNHPAQNALTIHDNRFTSTWMNWHEPTFDGSNGIHSYTVCYYDESGTQTRWIDGTKIYTADWKWNASKGGTGTGPDATTILNLAVGGDWPGNTNQQTTYSADFDVYSVEYWGP